MLGHGARVNILFSKPCPVCVQMKRILLFGLDRGNGNVLTEAFSAQIAATRLKAGVEGKLADAVKATAII